MEEAAIAILQAVPATVQLIEELKANGQIKDQATADAALAAALASMNSVVDSTVAELGGAPQG